MAVELITVAADEADLRLDRWFKRRYPGLGHGKLEKLLRTGQVRVDGKRVKAGDRVEPGQVIRVPPMGDTSEESRPQPERKRAPRFNAEDEAMIRDCVIYRDQDVIVLNKPPGLATQGGTNTFLHVDALLDALKFESEERPRLVHRLDKDTSGVLLLGRTANAAAALAKSFKSREARKVYWALVMGVPDPRAGTIKAPIAKMEHAGSEKMEVNVEEGQTAITDFRTVDNAGRRVAWVHFEPRTGRTHQLRVHSAYLGTPIVGDGKYGGAEAHLHGEGISRKLHLHARAIILPHPGGGTLRVIAPLPEHMARSFEFFDFDESEERDPFARPAG